MYELCRHIMPSNKTCGSPAVKEKLFCRNHQRVHELTRTRRRNPNDFTYVIPFVFPEDRAAINYNLFLVNKALAEGRIDTRTANAMTSNIRVAAINLNRGPLLERDPKETVQRVILTPDGEEIAPPREALDPGESPLHHKNCPCRRCAEQFRGAAPEQHHADCQCGLCDPATETGDQNNGCHPEQSANARDEVEELALSLPKEPAFSESVANADKENTVNISAATESPAKTWAPPNSRYTNSRGFHDPDTLRQPERCGRTAEKRSIRPHEAGGHAHPREPRGAHR